MEPWVGMAQGFVRYISPKLMSTAELEAYLYQHIPLSKAMGVVVIENASRVILEAPLGPNINHQSSVFGGSESALALLAGWAWIRERVIPTYPNAQLVIASTKVTFTRPALGSFTATCEAVDHSRFFDHLSRKGKARINLTILLHSEGVVVGKMDGEFAAVLSR